MNLTRNWPTAASLICSRSKVATTDRGQASSTHDKSARATSASNPIRAVRRSALSPRPASQSSERSSSHRPTWGYPRFSGYGHISTSLLQQASSRIPPPQQGPVLHALANRSLPWLRQPHTRPRFWVPRPVPNNDSCIVGPMHPDPNWRSSWRTKPLRQDASPRMLA